MEDTERVKVQFVTREEELKVPEAPIYVPSSLKRYGLSEVVNQLLIQQSGDDTKKPIPFDFFADGTVLTSSINDYLTSQGLSTESTLVLEYARSILPPSFSASYAHDDWISSVKASKDSNSAIATGSYDGIVRLWEHSEVADSLAAHSGPVKAVTWTGPKSLVTGGFDRILCLWDVEAPKSGKNKISAALQGHTASVDDVAAKGSRIVSASADTTVRVWSTNYKDMPEVDKKPESASTASRKRRKLASASLPASRLRTSLLTLEGHSAPVTGVTFHNTDDHVVYSVSQDHSIRTWDITTGTAVDTRTTSFPLLSVTKLDSGLVACGSSARHITLHDPRSKTNTTQSQLIGHTNFVVSLAPAPHSSYMLLSGSHDGTARVWDVRANKAVYTIPRQSGEKSAVYGVDWHSSIGILSGGKDKQLQINTVSI